MTGFLRIWLVVSLASLLVACGGGGGEKDTTPPLTSASPAGGTYSEAQSVTLTCADGSGSGCRGTFYTTDGSTPTQGSRVYAAPIPISDDTELKFFSVDNAGNEESVRTERYVVEPVVADTTPPVTTASPAGGSYDAAQSVTLACDDGAGSGCATTYYTVDGSEPGTGSPVYTVPIAIAADTTLKFFSVDRAGNREATRAQTYTIRVISDDQPPLTSASPLGGTFDAAQDVVLTCNDSGGSGCAVTRYTTDGADPTDASTEYTAPIRVAADTTLKFFSVDNAGNRETFRTESYRIVPPCQQAVDSDGDSLDDCDELAGWAIDLELNGDGVIEGLNESQVHVTSDPALPDTDGDGFSDLEELNRRTNPNRADSDQDGLSDREEALTYFSSPTDVDSDDDATGPHHDRQPNSGLFDGNEVSTHHTSPLMDDTDGDNYSDYTEVLGAGRPLVADLPLIEVNIVSNLGVFLNARIESGCEISGQTMQAQLDRNESASAQKSETSTKKTLGASGTIHTEAGGGFAYIIPTVSAKVSVSATVDKSTSRESNVSFEKSSVNENTSEFRRYDSQNCFNRQAADGGQLTATLQIRNAGNRSVYLRNLEIGARRSAPASPGDFFSLASATLYPTESNPITGGSYEQHEVSIPVSAATAMDLLGDPSGLFFSVNDFEIRDEDGRNFAFIEQTTLNRTGMLEIDFGDGRVERYLIATNVERDSANRPAGVNLRWAMEHILNIPVGTEINGQGVSALAWIRDENAYKYDASKFKFWYILGNNDLLATSGFDFEDIVLRQGDFISLTLLQDRDNDGVFDNEEAYYGTDPLSNDTDRDMVEDRAEIDSASRHPVVPEFPAGQRVRQTASAGSDGFSTTATLVLLENGTLWNLRGVPIMLNTDLQFKAIYGGGEQEVWMGITTNNDLYAWGSNSYGMLGVGSADPAIRTVPQLVGSGFREVSVGFHHVLAIKSDQSLWAWGSPDNGRLGVSPPPSDNCTEPTLIDAGSWIHVAAGGAHSLGIKSDGTLWAWGKNNNGQVGNGTTTDQPVPVQIHLESWSPGDPETWSKVAAGANLSLATNVSSNQEYVVVWGDQRFTEFGDGDNGDPAYIFYTGYIATSTTCSTHAQCEASTQNNMRCVSGRCNIVTPYIVYPHLLLSSLTMQGAYVVSLSSTYHHFSVTRGDIVATGIGPARRYHWDFVSSLTWGYNQAGQLGQGSGSPHLCYLGSTPYGCNRDPTEILDPAGAPFAIIDKGRGIGNTVYAENNNSLHPPIGLGELSVWGPNDRGQLGLGPSSGLPVTQPTLVPDNP